MKNHSIQPVSTSKSYVSPALLVLLLLLLFGSFKGRAQAITEHGLKVTSYLSGKGHLGAKHATLTYFAADTAVQATGTAVILLNDPSTIRVVDTGGVQYAVLDTLQRGLIKKGVAVFTLLTPTATSYTNAGLAEDVMDAVSFIRSHHTDFKVVTSKIGILGYGDKAAAARTAGQEYKNNNQPNFVALLNMTNKGNSRLLVKGNKKANKTRAEGTAADIPVFVAFNRFEAGGGNALYKDLLKVDASGQTELHLFKGGFGDLLGLLNDWMDRTGLLKPTSNEKTYSQKWAEGFANLQKYYDHLTFTDWAWLFRYEGANKDLKPPVPGEKRVVFMGNSITEYWNDKDAAYFKDNGYINRGIGGQVSGQMLVRFREDVIALKPAAVVINAGTNDIAENRGPISLENILGNIVSMAQLAKANGIIPIIASVLPSTQFTWGPKIKPAEKIIQLNKMLKAYALKNNFVYIDYWSALVNDKNGMKVELAQDGYTHPNIAGYKIMEPIAKTAIDRALEEKVPQQK